MSPTTFARLETKQHRERLQYFFWGSDKCLSCALLFWLRLNNCLHVVAYASVCCILCELHRVTVACVILLHVARDLLLLHVWHCCCCMCVIVACCMCNTAAFACVMLYCCCRMPDYCCTLPALSVIINMLCCSHIYRSGLYDTGLVCLHACLQIPFNKLPQLPLAQITVCFSNH